MKEEKGVKREEEKGRKRNVQRPNLVTNGVPVGMAFKNDIMKYRNVFSVSYDISKVFGFGRDFFKALIATVSPGIAFKVNYYHIPLSGGTTYLVVSYDKSDSSQAANAAFTDVETKLRAYGIKLPMRIPNEARVRILFDYYNRDSDRTFLEGVFNDKKWAQLTKSGLTGEKKLVNAVAPSDMEFGMNVYRLNGRYGRVMFYQHTADLLNNMRLDLVRRETDDFMLSAEISTGLSGSPVLSSIFTFLSDTLEEATEVANKIALNYRAEKIFVSAYGYKQKDGFAALSPTGTPALTISKELIVS